MSYVVYRGPSAYSPDVEIIAVLTGLGRASRNPKTGPMAQLYIMRMDAPPHAAQRDGSDSAVCGDCPLRPALVAKGAPKCYVRTFQAPLAVWKANRDKVVDLRGALAALMVTGRKLRLGAYGDTAALPVGLVEALASVSSGVTNYTHKGERGPIGSLARFAMASAQDIEGARKYWGQGLRTFRVLGAGDEVDEGREVLCPNYTHGTTCANCGLCDGTRNGDKRKSVAIPAH